MQDHRNETPTPLEMFTRIVFQAVALLLGVLLVVSLLDGLGIPTSPWLSALAAALSFGAWGLSLKGRAFAWLAALLFSVALGMAVYILSVLLFARSFRGIT